MYSSMDRSVSYNDQQRLEEDSPRDIVDQEHGPQSTPPITFADLGIPTGPAVQNTAFGKVRLFSEVSWPERFYVAIMLMAILAVASFTVYRVATVDQGNSDFVFGLVLLLNCGFCLWLVVDGVLRERPSELFILSIATLIIVIYLIINYTAGTKGDIKLARLIVGCVLCPLLVGLGLKIAWEYSVSKRLIFRTVGANSMLQKLYKRLLVFQDCLKLDVQLGASMVILIVVSRLSFGLRDIIFLSVGGGFTIIWGLVGYFSFPRESKLLACLFFVFIPAQPAYVAYKMYDVSHYIDSNPGLAAATIACGVLALVVRVFIVIGGFLVYKGFGQGLKEELNK